MKNFTLKAGSLTLILSFFTMLAIPASAKAESEEINFKTHDGVSLKGKFYPSAKPKDGASIILCTTSLSVKAAIVRKTVGKSLHLIFKQQAKAF